MGHNYVQFSAILEPWPRHNLSDWFRQFCHLDIVLWTFPSLLYLFAVPNAECRAIDEVQLGTNPKQNKRKVAFRVAVRNSVDHFYWHQENNTTN